MATKVIMAWSGGKDSALSLYYILKNKEYEVVSLLTTVSEEYGRITMHGVREKLLDKQAQSIGIPVKRVYISKSDGFDGYNNKMEYTMKAFFKGDVKGVVFGDIFLEDVKKYREENLSKVGMYGIFPLWGKNTKEIAKEFISLGFKAILACVDGTKLDESFVGREYNGDFVSSFPDNLDVCGENGEFHSFVYDGPIFKHPIEFEKGEKTFRDNRFYYIDLK
ncbi:MAG: diphthine--ammonia ligase [Thermoplasmata archaeon]